MAGFEFELGGVDLVRDGGLVGLGWGPIDPEPALQGYVELGGWVGAVSGGVESTAEREAACIGFEGFVAEFEFEEGPTLVVEGVEEVGPV